MLGRQGVFSINYIRERGCIVDIDFMVTAGNSGYTACGKTIKLINECVEKRDDALVIIANKYDAREIAYYFLKGATDII